MGAGATRSRWAFPAREAAIELVAGEIECLLTTSGLDPLARIEVLVAVREALTNAVRHGCGGDPRQTIAVELSVEQGGGTVVQVIDPGPAFDPTALPDPLAPENRLRIGGRGVFIMRHHMDEVEYAFPPDGGTVLTLRRTTTSAHGRDNHNEGEEMAITTHVRDNVTIIEAPAMLSGESGRSELDAAVDTARQAGAKNFIIDMSQCEMADSSGVGELVRVYQLARKAGGDAVLVNVKNQPREVLRAVRVDETFKTFDTEDEAVKSFA